MTGEAASHAWAGLGVGLALASAPGPVQAVLLGEAIRGGVGRGIRAMAGANVTFGLLLVGLALGLSVAAPSGAALRVLKVAGGGLLLWLAVEGLRSRGDLDDGPADRRGLPPAVRGALAVLLNPGAWLFLGTAASSLFAASSTAGREGALVAALALVIGLMMGDGAVVFLGGVGVRGAGEGTRRWVRRILAAVLAGVGLWLVFSGLASKGRVKVLRSVKLAQVFDYPVLERFWHDADDLGFHAVWDYDHFYGMRDPLTPSFDGWSMLAAMSAVTSRVRIGCMVTGVTYRHPAILAKMAVSVDHISSGRLEFGIGAASHEGEHVGYGIPFPSAGTRIDMLDEACGIIRRLWTEDTVAHEGRFWRLSDALSNPKPVQDRVPIVIGGTGEKTLRVVARHADEWNFSPMEGLRPEGPGMFARLSAVLDEHCAAVGRDPASIRRSLQMMLSPSDTDDVRTALSKLDEYEREGAGHVVLAFVAPPSRSLLESLASG